MRAAVHAAAGEIRLETRPAPRIGSGELLLRVLGCGLCGSDLAKLRGPTPRPAVLGHEVVGEVTEAGDGADLTANVESYVRWLKGGPQHIHDNRRAQTADRPA